MPQSQATANPWHQEEEKKDKNQRVQNIHTHEKHINQLSSPSENPHKCGEFIWTSSSFRNSTRTQLYLAISRFTSTSDRIPRVSQVQWTEKIQLSGFYLMYLSRAMRKCVFGSLRPCKTQTELLSRRDQLESWNFGYINWRYHSVLAAKDKGADQTARMRRLICTFVVRIRHKTHFLMASLIYFSTMWGNSNYKQIAKVKKGIGK